MNFNEIFTYLKDSLTPLLLLTAAVAGIIENSKKITAQPVSSLLGWIGRRMNADLQKQIAELKEQQEMQEAYELNDFFNRHERGEEFTREQYELAIDMYERHLARGANHINKLHLVVLKKYYEEKYGHLRGGEDE